MDGMGGKMTDKKLKPCPFCGSANIYVGRRYGGTFVECSQCKCKGPIFYSDTRTDPVAIKGWNTRAEKEGE